MEVIIPHIIRVLEKVNAVTQDGSWTTLNKGQLGGVGVGDRKEKGFCVVFAQETFRKLTIQMNCCDCPPMQN